MVVSRKRKIVKILNDLQKVKKAIRFGFEKEIKEECKHLSLQAEALLYQLDNDSPANSDFTEFENCVDRFVAKTERIYREIQASKVAHLKNGLRDLEERVTRLKLSNLLADLVNYDLSYAYLNGSIPFGESQAEMIKSSRKLAEIIDKL